MYKCFIKLIICSIEMSNGIVHVLSLEQDKFELPMVSIDSNINDIKSKLFEKYVRLGSSWTSIKIIKPVIEEDNLYLYYTSINGFWLNSITCCAIDHNLQECLRYV
jgi:hypothetical protein